MALVRGAYSVQSRSGGGSGHIANGDLRRNRGGIPLKSKVGAIRTAAELPRPWPNTPLEARVRKVLEMAESGAPYTIRDLAAQFRLSRSHLQRLFKQQTGVCIGEWLNEQRLQRAAYLLANSYLSVKEITHTVGYEHPSSFIRAFERRFAHAPKRYRERGCKPSRKGPLDLRARDLRALDLRGATPSG
jgi:AraC-like DNA-binding protein